MSPCGPGKVGDRLVPDFIFEDACSIHDAGYADPGDRTKAEIDWEFKRNMVASARKRGFVKRVLWTPMIWLYWANVRFLGRKAWERSREANDE